MSSKYTAEQLREVERLSIEVGPVEAARRLGIPRGSIWDLRRQNSTRPEAPPPIPPVPAPPPAPVIAPAPPPKPRGVARLYTPSQKAQAIELAAKIGVRNASKELRISRWSVHEWRRLAELAAAGKGPSPTSGPDPKDVETLRDREILAVYKEHPGLGPSQVRNQLHRKGIKVAVGTTRHVMIDAGYRPPKVKREPHLHNYEAVRPNHLWHMDFVHRFIGKTSTFTLILIDDYSRFVIGSGVDDAERANMVISTFEAAVARHGRPEMVMHDKGSAFWSWNGISRFTALLEEMEIAQIPAQHKEWNGKSEVFNANLHKEFFNAQRFVDAPEMRRRLQIHLDFYNHRRTHHALGGLLVPADRYFGRADEVLARIEAGGVVDPKDHLDLDGRDLDLFRVTSRNGKPEVWLMGTKILN